MPSSPGGAPGDSAAEAPGGNPAGRVAGSLCVLHNPVPAPYRHLHANLLGLLLGSVLLRARAHPHKANRCHTLATDLEAGREFLMCHL